MWHLIKIASADTMSDIRSSSSRNTADLLSDLLHCRRPAEECIVKLKANCKSAENVNCIIPVPNEETAFAQYAADKLRHALCCGSYTDAADICRALAELPELSDLSDKDTVSSFNKKYGRFLPLQLQLIRK